MQCNPLQPRPCNDKASVVILVPRYKASLHEDEQISLRHLQHYLGGYDTRYIGPQSLTIENPEFPIQRFDDEYFSGIPGYNRLMLSKQFYEAFTDWEYILIYQLDCLVFSDQLAQWCAKGYDYIGAPWLKQEAEPEQGFKMVGNGGFSLRRVSSALKTLDNAESLRKIWVNALRVSRKDNSFLTRNPLWWFAKMVYRQPVRHQHNEDWFWSALADKHNPEFEVPTVDVALSFGFECGPRYCFQMNNYRLPFGCHAWARYDRAFWEPYLLSD
jgi:hypothetical protein